MSITPRTSSATGQVDEVQPTPPGEDRLAPRPNIRSWALLTGVIAVSAFVFWIVHESLIDDSYIALTYARNLATNLQWGMLPTETSNTVTSPLNTVVLAAATAVLQWFIGLHPVVALGAVFVAANVVLAFALLRASAELELPAWCGSLATGLVLLNPLVLSAVGLEMTLASALLGMLLLTAVRARPARFGAVSGLLVLTRIDLGVFVIVASLSNRALRRAWWKAAATALAVCCPWFLFSWFALGSAIPDTLVIKQTQEYWEPWTFSNGLQNYFTHYPVAVAFSVVPAALAVIALLAWLFRRFARRPESAISSAAALGFAGVAHYLAYTQLGVPPYHWYYAPGIIGLSIFLAFALGRAARAAPRGPHVVFGPIGGFLLAAQGAFALQHGIPWHEAPITSNGATSADYARMGRELGERVGDATVSSPGEIGALAYFCHCNIVDDFSDRGYLASKIAERTQGASAIGRWLIELNYAHLDFTAPPRPVDYDLRRVDGVGPDPLWNGDSSYHDPAHFVLEQR